MSCEGLIDERSYVALKLINVHHNPWHPLILHACTCTHVHVVMYFRCTCMCTCTFVCRSNLVRIIHSAKQNVELQTAMLLCCIAMSLYRFCQRGCWCMSLTCPALSYTSMRWLPWNQIRGHHDTALLPLRHVRERIKDYLILRSTATGEPTWTLNLHLHLPLSEALYYFTCRLLTSLEILESLMIVCVFTMHTDADINAPHNYFLVIIFHYFPSCTWCNIVLGD